MKKLQNKKGRSDENPQKSMTFIQYKNNVMDPILEQKIKQWKEKYGVVHQIDVPLEDESQVATAYFRKPDLQLISAAAKFSESDPIKSGNILFENCWLGGDELVKSDDEARLSAIQALGQIFKVRTAAIKKL